MYIHMYIYIIYVCTICCNIIYVSGYIILFGFFLGWIVTFGSLTDCLLCLRVMKMGVQPIQQRGYTGDTPFSNIGMETMDHLV